MPQVATRGVPIEVRPVPPPAAVRVRPGSAARAAAVSSTTPTMRLRSVIQRKTVGSVEPADLAAFEPWLQRELGNCTLRRTKPSHVVEHGQTVALGTVLTYGLTHIRDDLTRSWTSADLGAGLGGPGDSVRLAAAAAGTAVSSVEIRDGLLQILDSPVVSAVAEFRNDLLEAVTTAVGGIVEDAGGVVGSVLEHLPGIGVLGAAVNLIRSSATMVMQAIRWPKIDAMLLSSISVIEREVLLAADLCEQRRREVASRMVGTSLAKAGAYGLVFVGVPAPPIVSAITTIIELTARILRFLVDAVLVRRANGFLERGEMTVERLRDVPALGLALPYLPGTGALHLLGIVPPGWRADTDPTQTQLLREALRSADNVPLIDALKQDVPTPLLGGAATAMATAVTGNPWRHELARLATVREETHRNGFDYPWKLWRGNRLVFDPQPVELGQKIGNVPAAAWRWLRGIPTTIDPAAEGGRADEQDGVPAEAGAPDDLVGVDHPDEQGEADGQRPVGEPSTGRPTTTHETATRIEPRLPNTDDLTVEDV